MSGDIDMTVRLSGDIDGLCPACGKKLREVAAGGPARDMALWNAAIDACVDAQPCTAENPNEDSYQRGKFDGVMAYGRAMLLLRRYPASDAPSNSPARSIERAVADVLELALPEMPPDRIWNLACVAVNAMRQSAKTRSP